MTTLFPRFISRSGITFFLAAALCCAGAYNLSKVDTQKPLTLASLQACITDTPEDISVDGPCLNRMISQLLDKERPEDLLTELLSTSTPEVVQRTCHPITHIIGGAIYAQSSSTEEALNTCGTICNNGCIHGVVGAAVEKELGTTYAEADIEHADLSTIKDIGARYCAAGKSLCHAIGHILYMASEDYEASLKVCGDIGGSELNSEYCYEGVYMQASSKFNSLIPGTGEVDEAPISQPSDYGYPCNTIPSSEPQYLQACFMYLNAFQLHAFLRQGLPVSDRRTTMRQTCETFSGLARAECYYGYGFFSSPAYAKNQLEPITVPNTCENIGEASAREACTLGVTYRFTNYRTYQRGTEYCEAIPEDGRRTSCYEALFQGYEHQYPEEGKVICRQNQRACMTSYEQYLTEKDLLPDIRVSLEGFKSLGQ